MNQMPLMCARWNPANDNQIALANRSSSAVELFDLTKSYNRPAMNFTGQNPHSFGSGSFNSSSYVEDFVFASFGPSSWKSVVMGGTDSGSVRIWDIRTEANNFEILGNQKRKTNHVWKSLGRSNIKSGIKNVMMSSDNNLAIAVHSDGIVQIWDVRHSPEDFDILQVNLPTKVPMENLSYTSKISSSFLFDDYLLFCQLTDGSIIQMNLSTREQFVAISSSSSKYYYMDRKFSYCSDTGHLSFATGRKNYFVSLGSLDPYPKPDIIVSDFQCNEMDKISVSQANPSLPYHGVCGFESGYISAYGIL
jgi:hypothetical protein